MTDAELFPPVPPGSPGTEDGEDSAEKIKGRLLAVKEMVDREDRKRQCYAAAMARKWNLPACTFLEMQNGPRKLELTGRGYVYKTAGDNDGVKTLLEMCLDSLDKAYEMVGDMLRPESYYDSIPGGVPTAYEHNKCLCIVKNHPVCSNGNECRIKTAILTFQSALVPLHFYSFSTRTLYTYLVGIRVVKVRVLLTPGRGGPFVVRHPLVKLVCVWLNV